MTINKTTIINVSGIDVEVTYKKIKHLNISVHAPLGNVKVSAPIREINGKFDEEGIRLAVTQRLLWIKKHGDRLSLAEYPVQNKIISGEMHDLWGIPHVLNIVEHSGRAFAEIEEQQISLYLSKSRIKERRLAVLNEAYRQELCIAIPSLISKWEPIVGRTVGKWNIRQMKTRWGSCNCETNSILLNLELAKKHPDCLEYVVVHEMVHLLERTHGKRFVRFMDNFLPDWKQRKDHLNGILQK